MMQPPLLFVLLSIISFVSSLSYLLHEKREVPLQDAFDRQRLDGDVLLPMRISLRQNENAILNSEAWLMAVSDPKSPQYGQHWVREDIYEAFEPRKITTDAVIAWLLENGIKQYSQSENRQWLILEIPVRKAEELLKTQFFEHRDSKNRFKVSCDEYSLPSSLSEHIDFVSPGVVVRDITGLTQRSRDYLRNAIRRTLHSPPRSPEIPPYPLHERDLSSPSSSPQPYPTASFEHKRPPFAPDDLTHCYRTVSPACIRALYNFEVADPNKPVSANNTIGIFQSLSLTRQSDMKKFFEYYTNIPPYTATIYDSIDGAIIHPNQTRGWRDKYKGPISWLDVLGEATLDLQMAYPIVWPQTVTVFETDDWYWETHQSLKHGQFNDFLSGIDGSYCRYTASNSTEGNSTMFPTYPDPHYRGYNGTLQCGAFTPTNVISISYGITELYVSQRWQERECLEFLKLGLQGVSVFVASGDFGVGYCYPGPIGDRLFNPGTPSACPWITSVGGTRIQRNHSVYDPEVAVHGVYFREGWSGGGFSIVFDRPAYQEQAVTSYFSRANLSIPYFTNGQYKNNTGRYNRNGRGFPDISAVALDLATVIESTYWPWPGTSAATPIVAALFNRITEERIRIGKGPLGFINPALYQNAEALNDVLQGNNRGRCSEGFKCIEGWDPVTGLGTPNYPKLLDLFLNLP